MIWWTCFFAAAAANSLRRGGGIPGMSRLHVHLYTEPKTVHGGESFDVFCSYDPFFVTKRNFLFSLSGDKLNTVPVNNFTIMHRTLNTPKEGGGYGFQCRTNDHFNWIHLIVIPKLNVRDFECVSKGDELVVVCSFSQLGSMVLWNYNEYYLSLDNNENNQCQSLGTRIKCTTNYLNATTENLNHTFVLQLNFNYDIQKQIFHLSRTQMKVPPWPHNWSVITLEIGLLTCIRELYYYKYYKFAEQDWKLLLVPRNPRIMQQAPELTRPYDRNEICFRTPRYKNQTFELRMWSRYIGENTPWTRDYFAVDFHTEASRPDRSPQLLPGVFFYDPDKKNFQIFWRKLEELDLTYIVQTDTGKKALLKTNTSAVFHQWDPTHSATVLVWSKNSVGQSENSSKLNVPVLTNAELHQPQDLWYNIENQTMTWKPPKDVNKLVSYIVIWCFVSSNITFICEDQKGLQSEPVPASMQKFQFKTQAADLNKAVVALYEDGSSGGMVWNGPSFTAYRTNESKSSGDEKIFYIIGLVGAAFLPIIAVLIRKLKKMSQIEIVFPVGLFDCIEMKNGLVHPPSPITIPGSVSPRGLVNIKMTKMETIFEEGLSTVSSSYVTLNEPSVAPSLHGPTKEPNVVPSSYGPTKEPNVVPSSYVPTEKPIIVSMSYVTVDSSTLKERTVNLSYV